MRGPFQALQGPYGMYRREGVQGEEDAGPRHWTALGPPPPDQPHIPSCLPDTWVFKAMPTNPMPNLPGRRRTPTSAAHGACEEHRHDGPEAEVALLPAPDAAAEQRPQRRPGTPQDEGRD